MVQRSCFQAVSISPFYRELSDYRFDNIALGRKELYYIYKVNNR